MLFVVCLLFVLLFAACCSLCVRCWQSSVVYCLLFAVRCFLFVVGCLAFVVGCSLFVVRCSLLVFVVRCLLCVARFSFFSCSSVAVCCPLFVRCLFVVCCLWRVVRGLLFAV